MTHRPTLLALALLLSACGRKSADAPEVTAANLVLHGDVILYGAGQEVSRKWDARHSVPGERLYLSKEVTHPSECFISTNTLGSLNDPRHFHFEVICAHVKPTPDAPPNFSVGSFSCVRGVFTWGNFWLPEFVEGRQANFSYTCFDNAVPLPPP